jgi:hypothetical protein
VHEFVAVGLHGEDLVGRPLQRVADVTHHAVEEDQLQVVLEVTVGELLLLLLALQLQHILHVVQINQSAKFRVSTAILDLPRVVRQLQVPTSRPAVATLRLELEPVQRLLQPVEEFLLSADVRLPQIDDSPSEGT